MASRTAHDVGPFTILMRIIFKNILMHVCLSLGLFGNIITLITLLEKRMRRSSTTQYLAAITLFDSIHLISTFMNSLESIYPSTRSTGVIPYLNLFFYPLSDLSGNISVYCILMFTIERYVAIAYPLRSRLWCHPSRARKIIGLSILFCFVFTFPTFLENKIVYEWDENLNKSMPQLSNTNIFPNFDLYKRTYFWIIAVLFQFIPIAMLIVLNSILTKFIHKSRIINQRLVHKDLNENLTVRSPSTTNFTINQKKSSKEPSLQLRCNVVNLRQHEQSKSVYLLVATVLVFLICQLPNAFLLTYVAIFPIGSKNSLMSIDIIIGLNNIANGLVAINASINFILYSCLSETFLRNFLRIFFKRGPPANNNIHRNTNFNSEERVNSNFLMFDSLISRK